jgi:hypothetical protein
MRVWGAAGGLGAGARVWVQLQLQMEEHEGERYKAITWLVARPQAR